MVAPNNSFLFLRIKFCYLELDFIVTFSVPVICRMKCRIIFSAYRSILSFWIFNAAIFVSAWAMSRLCIYDSWIRTKNWKIMKTTVFLFSHFYAYVDYTIHNHSVFKERVINLLSFQKPIRKLQCTVHCNSRKRLPVIPHQHEKNRRNKKSNDDSSRWRHDVIRLAATGLRLRHCVHRVQRTDQLL